jgi:hypothetical protein
MTTAVRWRTWAVVLGSIVAAVVSARPYAGGWNDGSRLATVECLVDHGTWAIDESIFVHPAGTRAYSADEPLLTQLGTQDKLLINGRYYSDKSPVPALLMAGEYAVLKAITGWTAADQTEWFCWSICLLSSGLAYVLGVWSMDRLGRLLRLSPMMNLALTTGFALTTLAPVYVEFVNNHILLLGVTTVLLVELIRLSRSTPTTARLVGAGTLAGLAYTIDLGAGPIIMLGAAGLVAYRARLGIGFFVVAASPWVGLHHNLNYAIGGTFGPANAHVEYLMWPGSPFSAANATGGWNHPGISHFVIYAICLLIGTKGFLIHNLPLLLAVPASVRLIARRVPETPELVMAAGWAVGTWLLYGAASTNSGGVCCSVRWFVPLLAPGYFILAVLLRELPTYRRDFAAMSAWAAAMASVMWQRGPWMPRLVPHWWVYVSGAAVTWILVRWWTWSANRTVDAPPETRRLAA